MNINFAEPFVAILRVRHASHTPEAATHAATNQRYIREGGAPSCCNMPLSPTPKKYTAAASINNPITCLTTSLAAPARGIFSTSFGNAASTRYGTAIPNPIAPNTVRVSEGSCLAAQSAAAPINGAVHGVDRTAVIIPNINEPYHESCFGFTAYTKLGSRIEKRPPIPIAIMPMKSPNTIVNAGY